MRSRVSVPVMSAVVLLTACAEDQPQSRSGGRVLSDEALAAAMLTADDLPKGHQQAAPPGVRPESAPTADEYAREDLEGCVDEEHIDAVGRSDVVVSGILSLEGASFYTHAYSGVDAQRRFDGTREAAENCPETTYSPGTSGLPEVIRTESRILPPLGDESFAFSDIERIEGREPKTISEKAVIRRGSTVLELVREPAARKSDVNSPPLDEFATMALARLDAALAAQQT